MKSVCRIKLFARIAELKHQTKMSNQKKRTIKSSITNNHVQVSCCQIDFTRSVVESKFQIISLNKRSARVVDSNLKYRL